jgi:hypothetical protein
VKIGKSVTIRRQKARSYAGGRLSGKLNSSFFGQNSRYIPVRKTIVNPEKSIVTGKSHVYI